MTGRPGYPPRRAFIDSSGYFALVDANDAWHAEARRVWDRLVTERWRTFTTNFVVAETHALFLARLGHQPAVAFLRQFDRSRTSVIRVTPADERRALGIIFQYEDKDFSLTDALSFAAMERVRIPTAFTFDRHFRQFGLPALTH